MSTLLITLLLAANPSGGCCTVEQRDTLCGTCHLHAFYYKRLYYGHYDRHPFDYRFQFDYPWHAGPSQPRWPIPPLPAAPAELWQDEFPTAEPSAILSARPAVGRHDGKSASAKGPSPLTLRSVNSRR
jgi:hypothetical protein